MMDYDVRKVSRCDFLLICDDVLGYDYGLQCEDFIMIYVRDFVIIYWCDNVLGYVCIDIKKTYTRL